MSDINILDDLLDFHFLDDSSKEDQEVINDMKATELSESLKAERDYILNVQNSIFISLMLQVDDTNECYFRRFSHPKSFHNKTIYSD